MRITIDDNILKKYALSLEDFLTLLLLYKGKSLDLKTKNLHSKGLVTGPFTRLPITVTSRGCRYIDTILVDSEPTPKVNILDQFKMHNELRKIYPKGKKDGTNFYWTESVMLIDRRLKTWRKKYPNKHTDEEIIQATTNYVKSFNGCYDKMRLLKYFILKNARDPNGEIVESSDLLNGLDNLKEDSQPAHDWTELC